MSYRKFFAGDVVQIVGSKYGRHKNHTGLIMGATIYQTPARRHVRVRYDMDCICGSRLVPPAWCMELLSLPPDDTALRSLQETRIGYFLDVVTEKDRSLRAGLNAHYAVKNRPPVATEQTEEILSPLAERDREVLIRRFGLDGKISMTLEAIGKTMGLTRQRIAQIEKRAIRSVRRFIKNAHRA